MKELDRLAEVIRSLARIEAPIDGLAALRAEPERLPTAYREAAASLSGRLKRKRGLKISSAGRPWV